MVCHPPSCLGITPKPEQHRLGSGGLWNGPSMHLTEHSEANALSSTKGCRKADERLLWKLWSRVANCTAMFKTVMSCVTNTWSGWKISSWCKWCVIIGVRECKADLWTAMNCCKWCGRCVHWVYMWVATLCYSMRDSHWMSAGWQFRCNDGVCSECSNGHT